MAAPSLIDYDQIEAAWREGTLSRNQLADLYNGNNPDGPKVTASALYKHFTKAGIPRDQSAKARAVAKDMVARSTVTGSVTGKATSKQIATGMAQSMAEITIRHQKTLNRIWNTIQALFDELELVNQGVQVIKDIKAAKKAGDLDALAEAVAVATKTLDSRSGIMKKLLDALDKAVRLERLVNGMEDEDKSKLGSHEERLKRLKEIAG